MTFLRHLLAIGVLPFTVTVLVPVWIARRNGIVFPIAIGPWDITLQAFSIVLLLIGLRLFAASVTRFAVEGKGTLAPWDPPRHLVIRGPYRFVRNPMIAGVNFVLLGEAGLLFSLPHLQWALLFLAANLVWIPRWEEPDLRRRFGDEYDEYCRNVPRLIPRLRPWVRPPNQV